MSLVLDCDVIFHESVCKVQISWEGHKIQKKFSHYIWQYIGNVKKIGRFFQNFVAFSEYLNFKECVF